MANAENLIPFTFDKRTASEQREIQRLGGIASGKKRRERMSLKQDLQAFMDCKNTSSNGDETTNQRAMVIAQGSKAIQGDTQAATWCARVLGEYGSTTERSADIYADVEDVKELVIIPKLRAWLDWQLYSDEHDSFLYGTTRSGKTYAICQWLVDSLRKGVLKGKLLIAGQTYPFLLNGSATYLRTICAELTDVEVLNNGMIVKHTNGSITCQSFAEPSRALSAQWDLVYLNEGNYIDKEVVDALRIRCAGQMITDFNPSLAEWWGANKMRPTNELFCSHKDNPFLTDAQRQAIEEIRERGESAPAGSYENWYYHVYYLGEFAEMGGGVFTKTYRHTPSEFDAIDALEVHGVDFGDTTDPNALVRVKLDKEHGDLWVQCLYYQTATDDIRFTALLSDMGVTRLVFETATGGNTRATNFRALGYKGKLIPCEKEQVSQGVFNISSLNIRCCDDVTYNEFKDYRIKDGKFSGADHTIDAVRYVAHLLLTNKIR